MSSPPDIQGSPSHWHRITGILRFAFWMLFRDRTRYLTLIGGLAFCTLLITQQLGVFCGIMRLTTSLLRTSGAEIWAMDQRVQYALDANPMRAIELQRVRSVRGVQWAAPLLWRILKATLPNGGVVQVQLTGLDSSTFAGQPGRIHTGRIENLRIPGGVIVDQVALQKFRAAGVPLHLGSRFEINGKQVHVVGICRTERSFVGAPQLFASYETAEQCLTADDKPLTFILVKPLPGEDPATVAARIDRLGTVRALTTAGFSRVTMEWYFKNTGIPLAFLIVVLMGILVGIAVTGQTFYLFVHDNLRYLAMMKAMGASHGLLSLLVLFQASLIGSVGLGIGLGLTVGFGLLVIPGEVPAFYLPWQVPFSVGILIGGITLLVSWIGIRPLKAVEPGMVFK